MTSARRSGAGRRTRRASEVILLHRVFISLVAYAAALVFASSAWAQTPQSSEESDDRPVLFLALPVYVGVPDFEPAQARAIETGVSRQLRSADHLDFVSPTAVRNEVRTSPMFEERLVLAASFSELGIRAFKDIDVHSSVQSLERGLDVYAKILYPAVAPEAIAEPALYALLAHLETKSSVQKSLQAARRLMLLDPATVLREGYYPSEAVRFFQAARDELHADILGGRPDQTQGRALAKRLDADLVLYAHVVPRDGGLVMVLQVFDPGTDTLLFTESAAVSSTDLDSLARTANRLASRISACLRAPSAPKRPVVAASEGASPWLIRLNFAYASFGKFPAEDIVPFGNYGASFAAGYLVTREFAFLAAFQVLTSIRDFDGILIEDFTTLRGFGGGELGVSWSGLRLAIGAAVELSTVGTIVTCPDPDSRISGCERRNEFDDFGLLLGINARPSLAYAVSRSVELGASASASFFFFPLSSRALNFPVAAEVGLQYRF